MNDDYQVDMTPLKDYARHCVTRRPYEVTVRPKDILAGAVQIQHFNIETMVTDDLKLVKGGKVLSIETDFVLFVSKQTKSIASIWKILPLPVTYHADYLS